MATASLPSVADRPGASVVIYDGDCRFCCGQVETLYKFDGNRQLAFLSLHDPIVSERYPDLTHEQLMSEMVVVDPQQEYHFGAEAVRYLSRHLVRLWWLAPLLHIPGSLPLWKFLYRQVAKRRYRLAGHTCDNGACKI